MVRYLKLILGKVPSQRWNVGGQILGVVFRDEATRVYLESNSDQQVQMLWFMFWKNFKNVVLKTKNDRDLNF